MLSNQYERMVDSVKGKGILGDSWCIKLEFEMAKEENPRYGQKKIACFRKVGFKYNLFSHNNDNYVLKNSQIIQQLFQWKRKSFRSKRVDSKLFFP